MDTFFTPTYVTIQWYRNFHSCYELEGYFERIDCKKRSILVIGF